MSESESFPDTEFRSRIAQLEHLLQEAETISDPKVREKVRVMVQTILELNSTGIARILDHIADAGEGGRPIIEKLGGDEMTSGLLLLYGLHPFSLQDRVTQALDKVRPYLHSHGGHVELVEITPGNVVKLRLEGSCHGCPSSQVTMKTTIEEALFEAAPEISGMEVEGLVEQPAPVAAVVPGFVPVSVLSSKYAQVADVPINVAS